MQLISFVEELG